MSPPEFSLLTSQSLRAASAKGEKLETGLIWKILRENAVATF